MASRGPDRPPLLMVAAQLLSWLVDWLKYRQLCNYHAYTAKLWGITAPALRRARLGYEVATFLRTPQELAAIAASAPWEKAPGRSSCPLAGKIDDRWPVRGALQTASVK